MIEIDINIENSVPSRRWLPVAVRRAHQAAKEEGVSFYDAYIYASLPEYGRCFIKFPQSNLFYAYW